MIPTAAGRHDVMGEYLSSLDHGHVVDVKSSLGRAFGR